jgi:hypothetical protein
MLRHSARITEMATPSSVPTPTPFDKHIQTFYIP